MGRQALRKTRILKKVMRKNWVKALDRNSNMASLGGFEPTTRCLEGRNIVFKLVNNMAVSELAKLTNFSKAYISNIKTGKLPPSDKFISTLYQATLQDKPKHPDYLALFIQSRRAMGCSTKTIIFYNDRLGQFVSNINYAKVTSVTSVTIQRYLNTIEPNGNGLSTRHASYRAIKTFYRWLNAEFGQNNPIAGVSAPIMTKPIMPALDENQVKYLIELVNNIRDKAIVALFVESGLRLSELANIKAADINWADHCIKVLGKGRKTALAPFGDMAEAYLKSWLSEYAPINNIWGMNEYGIATMLRRLEKRAGIPCNPHTFRRTFAVLLRKSGIDTMTIKELGRWESLDMVQRYTRSFSFQDSMKFYRSPLSP
jgi:integrase/recombinase XerC